MNDIQDNERPTITVITVTYNSGAVLKKTIESVAGQSYKNLEYIIIDGGSSDNTLDIISEYKQYITSWVSEPDTGIYNAMNKGLSFASGELIYFLNAGDYFYNEHIVSDIADLYIKEGRPDVIYGVVMTYSSHNNTQKRFGREVKLKEAKKGRVICHQAIFMKRQILQQYRFNEEYRITADYEVQVRCFKDGRLFFYVDKIISYYNSDGLSSTLEGKRDTVYEKMRIVKIHFSPVTYYRFYLSARLKLLRIAGRMKIRNLLSKTSSEK